MTLPATWYRKRDDELALHFARQHGVNNVFAVVGDVVHRDDLGPLLKAMDLTHHAVLDLFTPTELRAALAAHPTDETTSRGEGEADG